MLEPSGSRFALARARRARRRCPATTTRATPPPRWRPPRWPAPTRQAAVAAIATFAGAGRRFERSARRRPGARVVDDYAHHPTEVAATIAAARTLRPRRLVAVFQPHLVLAHRSTSRASSARALAGADLVCVLDVYPARERAEDFPGVSGRTVAEAVVDAAPGREVLWLPAFDDAERVLRARLREGDLLLVLGAGDVRSLGERLVAYAGGPAGTAAHPSKLGG